MEQIFDNAAAPATPIDNAKKEKIANMKAALKESLQSSPDFASKLHTLSDSLRVVNTLGYGKGGNIVVDKSASSADRRALKPTSAICGYVVENCGKTPIEYTTEVFAADEEGKFVGTVVKKVLAPGEKAQLTRQYMTMLCSIPEISFTLQNGKIISSSKKSAKTIKEELSAYYFLFSKDENGDSLQVNDDEVKLSVDDENGKVKAEYAETFGYLNNPKEGRGSRKSSTTKFTTQDLVANYIHKLLQEDGTM